jgi:hypothetical protein
VRSVLHLTGTLALLNLLAASVFAGETPALSGHIDRIIQARLDQAKIPASPRADDAEFLRRLYLDLTGRIPTYEQTTAFLSSQDPDKRAKLIEELLARPEYGLHFATLWRDLLVDRSAEKSQVRQLYSWEFVTWLAEGFNKGRGWNEIVTDLLTAEGEAKGNPATTFILTNRMNELPRPEDLVGMAGRLFMGIHIRCAQCHDHPYVDEWKQDDFWGLAAFFGQLRDHSWTPNGGNIAKAAFFEKPNPDAKKETAYGNGLKRAGVPPLQAGAQIAIPLIADPSKAQRVVKAKFFLGEAPGMGEEGPYRSRFAAWLTAPENPYFARAAVNRLWAHFFARGIVQPVDDMRPNLKPSHPELLDLLAKEFKSAGFNYKHLIRGICNSQAYQRTSKPLPQNKDDSELVSHMTLKQLNADQMLDSLSVAVGRAPPAGKNRDQATTIFATKEADGDPSELSHGIPQYLFQMNAGFANGPPGALNKVTAGKSKEEALTALYLAALSRPPRPAEQTRLLTYLGQAPDANTGYRDVYWVLLNSAEFLFNH